MPDTPITLPEAIQLIAHRGLVCADVDSHHPPPEGNNTLCRVCEHAALGWIAQAVAVIVTHAATPPAVVLAPNDRAWLERETEYAAEAAAAAPPPKWLTVREAAAELRVGRRTLDKAIKAGRLRSIMANGRDRRIARAWLDAYAGGDSA